MSTPCTCGHGHAIHSTRTGCLADMPGGFCHCPSFTPASEAELTAKAVAETDEAVERVERHADAAWMDDAHAAVHNLAKDAAETGQPFTADDVWGYLHDHGIQAPREPRALGAVMRAAVRAGKIAAVGYAPSRRRHMTPIRAYAAGPEL